MSKFIANVSAWTQRKRDGKLGESTGMTLSMPLFVVGGALLANGLHGSDGTQLAIGALSLVAAAVIATTR